MSGRNFLTYFQKFVKLESLAGGLLFGATLIALAWANSPYGESYKDLWEYKVGVSFQGFGLHKPLILWINDGLMAIFFFFIGLELKRELIIGEINTLKKAAFPFIAALGGVVVPIILYFLINQNPQTASGWGIPMATDIAFALAILSTLGNRIPLGLKVFLTAFAIIDDIAAVLVIAVFYSANINWMFVLYGIGLVVLLGLLFHKWKYSPGAGLIVSAIVWYLFLKSGIHPTIAGVLLAFTIPIKRKLNIKPFTENLLSIAEHFRTSSNDDKKQLLSKEELEHIERLDVLTFEVRSPLQHLEKKLHNWIAFLILPVFAFANAGVAISAGSEFNFSLIYTIIISLFAGKFIGVSLFSYLGIKLNWTELPAGLKFKQIIGIAAIAGVGFTMSIFIAGLAFKGDIVNINSAKLGIIAGSVIAGISGYIFLKLTAK